MEFLWFFLLLLHAFHKISRILRTFFFNFVTLTLTLQVQGHCTKYDKIKSRCIVEASQHFKRPDRPFFVICAFTELWSPRENRKTRPSWSIFKIFQPLLFEIPQSRNPMWLTCWATHIIFFRKIETRLVPKIGPTKLVQLLLSMTVPVNTTWCIWHVSLIHTDFFYKELGSGLRLNVL